MSVAQEAGHVVHDRGGVTWLDTRAMEWEPMPLAGWYQKTLVRDDEGEPSVTLNYVPPRQIAAGKDDGLPRDADGRYRHYHRIDEYSLMVWGENYGREYESAAQPVGDVVPKKQGYFMDRRAGSIHGTEPGSPMSPTGAVYLCWRDGGSGIFIGERDYPTQSVKAPFDDADPAFTPGPDEPHEAGAACVRNRGAVTVLDTRAMDWQPMPVPRWFQKVLVRDAEGEPSVTLNYVAPLGQGDGLPRDPGGRHRHMHKSVRELCYVLDGEGVCREYESPEQTDGDLVRIRQGYFMDRKAGSIHGYEPGGPLVATGTLYIVWREGGSGIWVGERDYDTESVEIPYD